MIDSGMDDFLGKPMSRRSLKEVLERNLLPGTARPTLERRGTARSSDHETPFDPGPMTELFDSDREQGIRVLRLFSTQARFETDALAGAIEERDAKIVCQVAHRLKGASLTVGAMRIAELCDRIQFDGTERRFERLPSRQVELERVVGVTDGEIQDALRGFRQ